MALVGLIARLILGEPNVLHDFVLTFTGNIVTCTPKPADSRI